MKAIRLLAVFSALLVFAASCGSDAATEGEAADDASTAESEAGTDESETDESETEGTDDAATDGEATDEAMAGGDYPVTIESDGGTWTIESAPERIVSLSPTATEILFAVGAGDQVVAADAFSNYPPEAPTTELSGFDPNIEAITAFEPDLVVIANDANDLVAGLTALEIPVLLSPAPADIESGYDEMAILGLASGHVDTTAEVIEQLRLELEQAFADAPQTPVRVYHELDETYFSASSNGFIGDVYANFGVENIADEADTDGSGFPQLSEEYIVEADPQLIIITDQVTYSPDDVAARPGWEQISAIEGGNVVVVEADVASRWGPRLPQFVTAVAGALSSVEPVGADS